MNTVPIIAITSDTEADMDHDVFTSRIRDEATDIENLDSDSDHSVIMKTLAKPEVDCNETDLEDIECSDHELEQIVLPNSSSILLEMLNLDSGTYEETVNLSDFKNSEKKLKSQSSITSFSNQLIPKVEDESGMIITDFEDVYTSGDEETPITVNDNIEEINLLQNIEERAEIDILDKFKKGSTEPNSEYKSNLHSKKNLSRKKQFPPKKLSDGAEISFSELANTELHQSDSDEEDIIKQENMRKRKLRVPINIRCKNSGTDIEEIYLSGEESIQKHSHLPLINYVHISDKTNEKYEDIDTEVETNDDKVKLKCSPPTDIEDFEADESISDSETELNCKSIALNVDNQINIESEPLVIIDNLQDHLSTDDEELNTNDEGIEAIGNNDTSDEDESPDLEVHFVKVISKGKNNKCGFSTNTLNVNLEDGGFTDVEDLDSESEEGTQYLPTAVCTFNKPGFITDTEDFCAESDDELLDDSNNDMILPEPLREMTVIKIDKSGKPVSSISSLTDTSLCGLYVTGIDEQVNTDTECFSGDEDGLTLEPTLRYPTPEINLSEGNIINAAEFVKEEKRKIKFNKGIIFDPVTDTEDILLETDSKKKRNKSKMSKPKGHLNVPTGYKEPTTDIEDLEMTDVEGKIETAVTSFRSTDCSEAKTDVEDFSCDEFDLHEVINIKRALSCTPDMMHYLGGEMVTTTEGIGPFSKETRQKFLNEKIPVIRMISPSPDVYHGNATDTEDIATSADEEGLNTSYSRAETATPLAMVMALEESETSQVHVKNTRNLDFESVSEAVHLKHQHDITESHTDVEDFGFSEDEKHDYKLQRQVSVEDDQKQVCVCLLGDKQEEICICIKKPNGELSMEWRKNNISTTATSHQSNSTNADWSVSDRPLGKEGQAPPEAAVDAAPTGDPIVETQTSVVPEASLTTRFETDEVTSEGASGASGTSRPVADQHQLSEEMKELLAQLEQQSQK